MNKQEMDVLKTIAKNRYENQRVLAERCGYSLGGINRSIKNLIKEGYLDEEGQITTKAKEEIEAKSPRNAIILAAGFGMRMVPINKEMPKALLEVKGEVLIERTINQLKEVGISEIYIVVGFMKEKFEYLIDDFGVKLIVNSDYAVKNNLHSLKKATEYLSNTYIVPCDIWCENNPFSCKELYSWYMVSDRLVRGSSVRVGRKGNLVMVADSSNGNAMIGISYITEEKAQVIKNNIDIMYRDERFDDEFWEATLYSGNQMVLDAKVVQAEKVFEINTYEQLREFDAQSNQLRNDAIMQIEKVFQVPLSEIKDIIVLKKGMTNRSFLFTCRGEKYIMRIPGEGTEQLINRKHEANVYKIVDEKKLCDDVIYINSDSGYKITKFLENVRVCNPDDVEDLKKCMKTLRDFHELRLKVDHEFDIFGQIEFYESLWGEEESVYCDYKKTKNKMWSLKSYIDRQPKEYVLTHIDAVPDNFLLHSIQGQENVRLIDWEYAGMQDPHVDIAMFCIYAMYDKGQVDRLIDIYFEGECSREIRAKIYCYIAVCGLLWSNWCEYKARVGVEFGEYSLCQYRFAKDYYNYAMEEIEKIES